MTIPSFSDVKTTAQLVERLDWIPDHEASQAIREDQQLKSLFIKALEDEATWCDEHQKYISRVISATSTEEEESSLLENLASRISLVVEGAGVLTTQPFYHIKQLIDLGRNVELHATLHKMPQEVLESIDVDQLLQGLYFVEDALVTLLQYFPESTHEKIFSHVSKLEICLISPVLNFDLRKVALLLEKSPKDLLPKLFNAEVWRSVGNLLKMDYQKAFEMCSLLIQRCPPNSIESIYPPGLHIHSILLGARKMAKSFEHLLPKDRLIGYLDALLKDKYSYLVFEEGERKPVEDGELFIEMFPEKWEEIINDIEKSKVFLNCAVVCANLQLAKRIFERWSDDKSRKKLLGGLPNPAELAYNSGEEVFRLVLSSYPERYIHSASTNNINLFESSLYSSQLGKAKAFIEFARQDVIRSALSKERAGKNIFHELYEWSKFDSLDFLLVNFPSIALSVFGRANIDRYHLERAISGRSIAVVRDVVTRLETDSAVQQVLDIENLNGPLFQAFRSDDVEIFQLLYQRLRISPLSILSRQNEFSPLAPKIVQFLLNQLPPTERKELPAIFSKAIKNSKVEFAEAIYTSCSDTEREALFSPDTSGKTPLSFAQTREDVQWIFKHCKPTAQILFSSKNPLIEMIKNYPVDAAEETIKQAKIYGIDQKKLFINGNPLLAAVQANNTNAVRIILENAAPNVLKTIYEHKPDGNSLLTLSYKPQHAPEMFIEMIKHYPKDEAFYVDYIEVSKLLVSSGESFENYVVSISHFFEQCPKKARPNCFPDKKKPFTFIYEALRGQKYEEIKQVLSVCDDDTKTFILRGGKSRIKFLSHCTKAKNYDLVLYALKNCPNQCRKELLNCYVENTESLGRIFKQAFSAKGTELVCALFPLITVSQINREIDYLHKELPQIVSWLSEIDLPSEEVKKRQMALAYAYLNFTGEKEIGLTMIRDFAANLEVYMPYLTEVPDLLENLLQEEPQAIERYIESKGGLHGLSQEAWQALLPLLPPKEIYDTIKMIPEEAAKTSLSEKHHVGEMVGTVGEVIFNIQDQYIQQEGANPDNVGIILTQYLPKLPPASISLFAKEYPELIEPFIPHLGDLYLGIILPFLDTNRLKKIIDNAASADKKASYISFLKLDQKRELLESTSFTPPIVADFLDKQRVFIKQIQEVQKDPNQVEDLKGDFLTYKPRVQPLLPHLRLALRLAASFAPIEVDPILAEKLQIKPQTIKYSKDSGTAPFQRQISRKLKHTLEALYEMDLAFSKLEARVDKLEQKRGLDEVEHPKEFLDPYDFELLEEPWCIQGKTNNYYLDKRSLVKMKGYVKGTIIHPITREEVALEKCKKDSVLQSRLDAYKAGLLERRDG